MNNLVVDFERNKEKQFQRKNIRSNEEKERKQINYNSDEMMIGAMNKAYKPFDAFLYLFPRMGFMDKNSLLDNAHPYFPCFFMTSN